MFSSLDLVFELFSFESCALIFIMGFLTYYSYFKEVIFGGDRVAGEGLATVTPFCKAPPFW